MLGPALALWLALVGGVLMLVSGSIDSPVVATVGVGLFLLGLLVVIVLTWRDSRKRGVAWGRSLWETTKAALGWLFWMLP